MNRLSNPLRRLLQLGKPSQGQQTLLWHHQTACCSSTTAASSVAAAGSSISAAEASATTSIASASAAAAARIKAAQLRAASSVVAETSTSASTAAAVEPVVEAVLGPGWLYRATPVRPERKRLALFRGWKFAWHDKLAFSVAALAFGLILANRMDWRSNKKEEEEAARKAEEAKEAERLELLPVFLSGKSFLVDGADAFEGLTPKEINALAEKVRGTKSLSDDPFDGMSPEEIDEYVAKHGLQ